MKGHTHFFSQTEAILEDNGENDIDKERYQKKNSSRFFENFLDKSEVLDLNIMDLNMIDEYITEAIMEEEDDEIKEFFNLEHYRRKFFNIKSR